jgi:hypothetical protein
MIPTVTLQSGAETQDSTIGEGKSLSTGEDDGFSTRGGMNDYYYRVDKKERRILVNGLPRPTVYLAYVSSGISISADEVFIPVECKASIETYILWQDALFNTQINKAAIGEYKRMFREEEMLLRSLQFPTVDQIMDIFYSSYTNTPKR